MDSTSTTTSKALTTDKPYETKAEMMRNDMVHSSRGLERHPNVESALEAYDRQMDHLRAAADSEAAQAVVEGLTTVKNSFLSMLQTIKDSAATQAVADFGSEVAATTSQAVADLGNEISAAAQATYDEYMGPPLDEDVDASDKLIDQDNAATASATTGKQENIKRVKTVTTAETSPLSYSEVVQNTETKDNAA